MPSVHLDFTYCQAASRGTFIRWLSFVYFSLFRHLSLTIYFSLVLETRVHQPMVGLNYGCY
jgi:hypothetical protein